MLVQINTVDELNIGDELIIKGTGEEMTNSDGQKEPLLEVINENDESFTGVIPVESSVKSNALTNAELVAKYPELNEDDGSITVSVVEATSTDEVFKLYMAQVSTGNTLQQAVQENPESEIFELTIKGSILQHPAKVDVISDFEDNGEAMTHIVTGKSGEPAIIYPKKTEDHAGGNLTAGEIQWEEDTREKIMKVLKQMDKIEAEVVESQNNTYIVHATIDSEVFEYALTGKKLESIDEMIERIHTDVGTPKETLNDIHVYLSSQGIPNKQVRALLEKIRPYDASVVDFIPDAPTTAYQDNKGLLKRAIAYLLGGESILMSGDAATGKNLMAETLCWVIQKPYRFYSINIQTDKYDLTGRTILQSQEEGGGTLVQDSFLVTMMKHGGAILLDEINASNPAVMTVLHSVVEKGHKMIDIESSDERVVAKEDFLLFGAMNPGYHGTGDLNEALHSRFATLNFGQNNDIIGLLEVHHESKEAPSAMLNQVNQLYTTLFENVQNGDIDAKVLSFRRYASAVYYAANGYIPLKDALIDNVANMVLDPFENQIIVDAIDIHVG